MPKTEDTIIPRKYNPKSALPESVNAPNCRTTAPKIAGIDIKNENSKAIAGLSPNNNAAVIVVPEREIPGIIAKTCAHPTIKAIFKPIFTDLFFLSPANLLTNKITALKINRQATVLGTENKISKKSSKHNTATIAGRHAIHA